MLEDGSHGRGLKEKQCSSGVTVISFWRCFRTETEGTLYRCWSDLVGFVNIFWHNCMHQSENANLQKVKGVLEHILEVQDNIPIWTSIISQQIALYSLKVGLFVKSRTRVGDHQLEEVVKNKTIVSEELSPLGEAALEEEKMQYTHGQSFRETHWRHSVVLIPEINYLWLSRACQDLVWRISGNWLFAFFKKA